MAVACQRSKIEFPDTSLHFHLLFSGLKTQLYTDTDTSLRIHHLFSRLETANSKVDWFRAPHFLAWVKFHFLVGVESHHINMPIIKFPANFTFSFCWSQHRRPTHFSDVKITNKSMEIMTNMEFLVSRKFCTSDVGD